jgi:hypothetical protein
MLVLVDSETAANHADHTAADNAGFFIASALAKRVLML